MPTPGPRNLELICPAGTPAGLRTAVDAGAHAVYCGFRDETNARNFPGFNFDRPEMVNGITYAPSAWCESAGCPQHVHAGRDDRTVEAQGGRGGYRRCGRAHPR